MFSFFTLALLGNQVLLSSFSFSVVTLTYDVIDSSFHASALDPMGTQVLYLFETRNSLITEELCQFLLLNLVLHAALLPYSSGLSFPLTEEKSLKNE